jgi:hypothetical protein
VGALYALYVQYGREPLLAAMSQAQQVAIYGADYLRLLLAVPAVAESGALLLPDTPTQAEIDRLLSSYEEWVNVDRSWGEAKAVSEGPAERRLVEVRR